MYRYFCVVTGGGDPRIALSQMYYTAEQSCDVAPRSNIIEYAIKQSTYPVASVDAGTVDVSPIMP